jgi:hypothetical protein
MRWLTWNCNAANVDGSVPELPQVIVYSGGRVTRVSVTVGSNTNAGQTATLGALDASFNVLDVRSVTLSSAMQALSTSAPGTALSVLLGPCVMVADDLTFN